MLEQRACATLPIWGPRVLAGTSARRGFWSGHGKLGGAPSVRCLLTMFSFQLENVLLRYRRQLQVSQWTSEQKLQGSGKTNFQRMGNVCSQGIMATERCSGDRGGMPALICLSLVFRRAATWKRSWSLFPVHLRFFTCKAKDTYAAQRVEISGSPGVLTFSALCEI